jgi:hypothetical protein
VAVSLHGQRRRRPWSRLTPLHPSCARLVFLDWSLASAYGYSCTIHPEQISCSLPANVQDEDIVDGKPLQPQPKEVHTVRSVASSAASPYAVADNSSPFRTGSRCRTT